MRITRLDNLVQLTWMPGFFPVNSYLIEEEDGLTLIDAALPSSVKGIIQAAAQLNKPLTRILLTHAHSDHIGALDGLKRLLPEARVYISVRDAALLGGDRSLQPGEPQTKIRGGVPKRVTTRPDVLLSEGDRIGSLTAFSTPGHTPGSMSFQDTRSGALIVGDAFQTFRGVAVSGTVVPWFPFPALATWSKEQALASAVRLLELQPALLGSGHGDLLPQPESAMRRAIEIAQSKLHKELV
ncbi:MBL fold metallo-hydrolase [Paenibacillus tepidiphilus]|uniref:MBL fold metallo-hydrolase n=1 Tax=Paenibacillus tepidiphilus TaxID=2608683 RepID=UPI00123B2122|nr:MBL fold metallo-hydrolase [Paenibacillus tepidiphilus]